MVTQALGRPRDAAIDTAVLRATVELLERDGYVQLTIADVAARAGTSKPAIYRRWPTKAHLVHDAVFPPQDAALPPARDARAAVRTLLGVALELLGRPAARAALPGLLADTTTDTALASDVLARAAGGTFVWLAQQLAADRSVRAGVSPRVVFDLVAGAAFMAVVGSGGRRVGKKWIDEIVDIVVQGIVA